MPGELHGALLGETPEGSVRHHAGNTGLFPELLERHARAQPVVRLPGGEPGEHAVLEGTDVPGRQEDPSAPAGRPTLAERLDLPAPGEFRDHPLRIRRPDPQPAAQHRLAEAADPGLLDEGGGGAGAGHPVERRHPVARRQAPGRPFRRQRVQDPAAADRDHRRVAPDDEAVPADGGQRRLKAHLHQSGVSGGQPRRSPEEPHPGERGGGADMEMDAVLILDRCGRPPEHLEPRIEHPGRAQLAGRADDGPAIDREPSAAGQVQRGPLPGVGRPDGGAVDLE
ncbi:MAG: hypothetical protein F4Y20_00355, partial [Acidobacteria bacterium]|nr:hypothetical protein [Acidobacteriota bacterium]